MILTNYEKENAASLLAVTNDYITALHKVGKLASENNWKDLQIAIDGKIGLMEKRARALLYEILGGGASE